MFRSIFQVKSVSPFIGGKVQFGLQTGSVQKCDLIFEIEKSLFHTFCDSSASENLKLVERPTPSPTPKGEIF